MDDLLSTFSSVFDFLSTAEIAGMSLVTWIVIVLVISGIGFIVRGNK